MPRATLIRSATGPDAARIAESKFQRTIARWRGNDRRESFGDFLERYRPGEDVRPEEFLADFDPGGLEGTKESCPACGAELFADEATCSGCGRRVDMDGLSPRAGCLAAILARMLRSSRGREMLVPITSLSGGEARKEVADLMALATTAHRRVHLVLPTHAELVTARTSFPGSMGHYPSTDRTLRDAEALLFAESCRVFLARLTAAVVEVHPLDDEAERDGIVAKLLLSGIA